MEGRLTHTPRRARAVIYFLFLGSGATSLIYEVLWLRQLILVFGSTLFATSAILSTFMGGLALGAFAAGKVLDRRSLSPLRLYGLLELGIGFYALAVPSLFSALTPLYRLAWEAGGSGSFLLFSLAKLAGIAAVLLPPTVLMGATLPAMARLVADDPLRIGGKVGTLYAVNTFGAAAGTFLAGFVLVPGIGMQKTGWATVTANLILALTALGLSRRAVLPAAGVSHAPSTGSGARAPRRIGLILIVFGLSGFSAMVLEVAWTRALALVVGSSVYAFSLMLLAFLVGLASGGATFSGLLRRHPLLDPRILLALLLATAGVLAYATAFVLLRLPQLFAEVYFAWSPGPTGWLAVQFALGLLVMFPTTFVLGGIFPAVLQLHARSLDRVAGSVGTVYASNTLGTIVGAGAGGFLLLPLLGVRDSVLTVAALEIVLGLMVALAAVDAPRRFRWALAAPMALALAVLPFARPHWDTRLMNSGAYYTLPDMPEADSWAAFVRSMEHERVVFAKEGLTSSVLVVDQLDRGNRYVAVNGKIEASTLADMETQLMCSHLPLLLHPSPRDVMVIGLASGITAGAAATHPVERIRIVEVEAAMVPAARLFSDFNGNVLDDPRVTLSINDARNELEFSNETYDVIISEPSNPWMTVASNLFTEDFFRLARTRIRPRGIFLQWIQTYCLPAEDLRSIVAAFRSAFPHVLLFQTMEGVDLLMLGSEDPLRFDMDRMAGRMSELSVRMDLARIEVRRPADLLPLFALGDQEVDGLVDGAPRNTDDNARVEFSAPRAFFLYTVDSNLALLDRYPADVLDYLDPRPATPEELDRLRLELAEAWLRRAEPGKAEALAREVLEGPLKAKAEALLAKLGL